MPVETKNAKVALVTGGARRIGAEIARTLHQADMNIVLHYHSSEAEAMALIAELNKIRPGSAVAVSGALTNCENTLQVASKALEAFGRMDALINNASKFYRTPFGDVTEAAWDDLLDSNIKAPFFLAQALRDALKQANGVIVNITDIHAERPLRDYSVYCLSKSALVMATKVLAKELGPDVRVNAVAPGSILWPEGENSMSAEEKMRIVNRTALKRSGAASDIAQAVLFFTRDASYATGQVIEIDGGRMLSD